MAWGDSTEQFHMKCLDAGNLPVSAKSGDANQVHVSSIQGDAGLFRVSAIGTVTVSAGLSESNAFIGQVSAIIKNYPLVVSGTVSAFINQGTISAYSPDAALFRVSGIGTFTTSAHEVRQSDAASFRVSSIIDNGSVSAKSSDGGTFRVSAIIDSGSVSAKSSGADTFLVSAKQGDAGVFRVSAIIDNGSVSAKSSDGGTFRVSAILDFGSVSAKSTNAAQLVASAVQLDAGLLLVSAKSGTATQFVVSSVQADAALQRTSAFQGDAALFRVSGFTATATNFPVSSVQADAGLQRISAIGPNYTCKNTTAAGGPTAVKATAAYFHNLIINDAAAKTIRLYNSNTTTDNIFATMDAPTKGSYNFDLYLTSGLTVSAVSASNMTFSYL